MSEALVAAPPVRLAVVGAGLIGRQHVLRIRNEPEATLAAIVDPSPAARDLAAGVGTPWLADLDELLRADRPDGVIIATPNQMHVANGLTAVAAGVPMLLEKPVADGVDAGWRLVEAAEQADVPILVGHHRRHSPLIQRAKAMVASERLGRITTVSAHCWFRKPDDYFDVAWRREPGGGPVLINLIHVIDDVRNICGEISTVHALESSAIRGFPVEDTAAVLLRLESGALGTITISDAVPAPWSWELTAGEDKAFPKVDTSCYLIGGTEGSLAVPELELWHYPSEAGWRAPIERRRAIAPEQDPLVLQLRQFCRVVRREEPPLLDGRSAMGTLEATLAVKESAATGRTVQLAARRRGGRA
ncbi:MAG TPA: Gfo/Idh/MocA family oxidoreductase [Geminicoccaceae bacterium]